MKKTITDVIIFAILFIGFKLISFATNDNIGFLAALYTLIMLIAYYTGIILFHGLKASDSIKFSNRRTKYQKLLIGTLAYFGICLLAYYTIEPYFIHYVVWGVFNIFYAMVYIKQEDGLHGNKIMVAHKRILISNVKEYSYKEGYISMNYMTRRLFTIQVMEKSDIEASLEEFYALSQYLKME